jgi:hypothetical protein
MTEGDTTCTVLDDLEPWTHHAGFFHFSAVVVQRVTHGARVVCEHVRLADPVFHPTAWPGPRPGWKIATEVEV